MSYDVLLLNSDYEPLNICNIRRAINLVIHGKVDILHEDGRIIKSISITFNLPSVIRLRTHVKRPRPQLKLSRRSVLARDNHTCQYCGHHGYDLTVDHIIPKRLNGPTSWDNLVCCCKKCNSKKGDKTLAQIGFFLKKSPQKPKYIPFISLTKFISGAQNEIWRDYLPLFNNYGITSISESVIENELILSNN